MILSLFWFRMIPSNLYGYLYSSYNGASD
jgi:hypothetical protein